MVRMARTLWESGWSQVRARHPNRTNNFTSAYMWQMMETVPLHTYRKPNRQHVACHKRDPQATDWLSGRLMHVFAFRCSTWVMDENSWTSFEHRRRAVTLFSTAVKECIVHLFVKIRRSQWYQSIWKMFWTKMKLHYFKWTHTQTHTRK